MTKTERELFTALEAINNAYHTLSNQVHELLQGSDSQETYFDEFKDAEDLASDTIKKFDVAPKSDTAILIPVAPYDEQLNLFVAMLQEKINTYFGDNLDQLTPPDIITTRGSKYDKVIRKDVNASGKSVHCFIDRKNGDIYKAASWASPAKHVRGNIYNEDPLQGTGIYGAEYLR